MLCIIRESQPGAFAAIQDNIHFLRDGTRTRPEARQQAEEEWKKALDALRMDDLRRAAVEWLVRFVFGAQDAWRKPQGVARHDHADYWERFLSIPRLGDEERDQPLLQVLLESDDAAVVDLLESGPPRSAAVEDFERLISRDRLVGLFLPLVERRSGELFGSWKGQEPPGLIPLWRMWNRRCERGELPATTVLAQVKRAFDVAIPRNLALVTVVGRYFVFTSPGVAQLLGPDEREAARGYGRNLLADTYRGRVEMLSEKLRETAAPTLLELCWPWRADREPEVAPFPEWMELMPTIVEAVRYDPRTMLPQVAWLLVKTAIVFGPRTRQRYDFDEGVAARLFGDVEAALDLFRGQDVTNWAGSPEVEAVLARLQE